MLIKSLSVFYTLYALFCLQSCVTMTEQASPIEMAPVTDRVRFFVYPSGNFEAAEAGDKQLEEFFSDILQHVGHKGPKGEVGVGLVFPYLTWTQGAGKGPYTIPQRIQEFHRQFVRVAQKMKMPVLVQFNGGPWHTASSESAFISHWKTVDGGKYLSRYKDGKVNGALHETGRIDKKRLQAYLDIGPYNIDRAQNSLFFTLSSDAAEFRKARLDVLHHAVLFWKSVDRVYPGVITDFTTDSEVASFSHRYDQQGNEIPIGYEEFMTTPFCKKFKIHNCKFYFQQEFTYKTQEQINWFDFRSQMHRQYVADTVSIIRKSFLRQPIWTHQIPALDEEKREPFRNRDFASPQSTAFVPNAFPGFTFYIHGKRDKKFKKLVRQISKKTNKSRWGMLEFNPGKSWKGSRQELREYTFEILNFAYDHGVRVISPLSWTDNNLDRGIRNSGVDAGIKRFVMQD